MFRSYPNVTDYWDANWCSAQIKAEIPGFSASFDNYIFLPELLHWQRELQSIYSHLAGSAHLSVTEEFLELSTNIDQLGNLRWNAALSHNHGGPNQAALEFRFGSDQSYLPRIIAQIENVFAAYPIVGSSQE